MEANFDKMPRAIVEKIQKLLKLQESAKSIGNIEEAANAADKISAILMRYNLDINDVKSANYEPKKAILLETIFDTSELEKSHEGGWVLTLTRIIARANMCRALSMKGDPRVWIVGTEVNAHTVWFIVQQLVNRLRPIQAKEWAAYTGYEKRNTWKRGFFTGAVTGIGEQLMRKAQKDKEEAKAVAGMIKEAERTEEQQTGVMIIKMKEDEENRVNEYVSSKYRTTRSTKRGTSSQGGKATGYATGSTMSIHSGITSGAKRIGNG